MGDNALQDLLRQVRQHLGAGPVDADTRQQLSSLVHDIEHKLGGGASQAEVRLESLAVKFEASHPALAETLRQVIDTLGKAGL
jgi:hypothetical protein